MIRDVPQLDFYDQLAAHYDVLVPEHPGYGESERPEWMRSVRDLSAMYQLMLNALEPGRPSLIGLGFGGWIAAEMATMAPRAIECLVLVGPMGIQPPREDEHILDQALLGYIDYAQAGFHQPEAFAAIYGEEPSVDQLVRWDICREMNFRIAWKPYMYSQTLPHLLKSLSVPTLVVCGDDDQVVPISAAQKYTSVLPQAKLMILPACGHCVDMEKPDELCTLVREFIG